MARAHVSHYENERRASPGAALVLEAAWSAPRALERDEARRSTARMTSRRATPRRSDSRERSHSVRGSSIRFPDLPFEPKGGTERESMSSVARRQSGAEPSQPRHRNRARQCQRGHRGVRLTRRAKRATRRCSTTRPGDRRNAWIETAFVMSAARLPGRAQLRRCRGIQA